MLIERILDQHLEESAFLWVLRTMAVKWPHFSVHDLTKLDTRLEGHLDGLRLSDRNRRVWEEALLKTQTEETFAAAVLEFETGNVNSIEMVLSVDAISSELCNHLISALAWLPYVRVEQHILKFLPCSKAAHRRIGIAASAVHRRDPGHALIDALVDDDLLLRARASKAVGELGRMDLLPYVQKGFTLNDIKCRFFAAWSAALLGDLSSVAVLKAIAALEGPYRERAAVVALRRMGLTAALKWQKELAKNPEFSRLAVIGAGAVGDSALISWLIDQMKTPTLARVAGESFTMITGVDIAYEDLEGERPEGFESGPTEDPEDENVEMDPDENLPWPNPELIQKWWNNHRSKFQNGTRYLIGKPITEEWLQQVLRIGKQRQRAAAALELVLRRPGQPLFEVRAPGFRQQQMLGLKVTR